ncbi:MAG: hypothetical protein ACOCTI_03245 [Phycisphaeraceae bacterium]
MQPSSIANPQFDALASSDAFSARRGAPGFAESLTAAIERGEQDEAEPNHADVPPQAREAAEQLVATAFIKPLLQQVRNDPFKSDLFHGGQGEEAFGQRLDTILADRMVQRMNFPLVDTIAKSVGSKVNTHG